MPDYSTLREANYARHVEWMSGAVAPLPLSFRGNELAGEAGELAEVLLMKWAKYSNYRAQWREHLAEELGDNVICCDLICFDVGVPLSIPVITGSTTAPDSMLLAGLLERVGKLCNSIKKYERTRIGIAGGIPLNPVAIQERAYNVLQDVARIAHSEGVDLDVAVARKFNLTSAKNKLTTLFIPPGYDRARLIPTGEHSYA